MAQDPVCGMAVDERSGLKLAFEGRAYFFCSPRCLEKFSREKGVPEKERGACLAGYAQPFYKNKVFVVSAVLALLLALSYPVNVLEPFRSAFLSYLKTIWLAVLLGLFLGGLVDRYIPREYVSHILARPQKRTIFYAVGLGFLMSACSHGILALSIELHKKGASNPAVVAFLLASPWANLTVTVMLLAFFGLKALYIIFSAVLIAVVTGLVFQVLEARGLIEKNENAVSTGREFSIFKDMKERFRRTEWRGQTFREDLKGIASGMRALADMVLWWILIGMALASLAGAYIPAHVFHHYMGPTLLGLLVTLALATVIEVCSEGSAPLAFEIFRQTGALGNSFVFLMAGVVTDYTEIGLLWHNVGKRTALWLPVVAVPQVVVLGFIANKIF